MKNLVKKIFKNKKKRKYGFFGDYNSFEEVEKKSSSYSKENILNITLDSTLKVKNKEAIFERDSFIFDKIQYSFPLLAALMKIGITESKLNVLDFGGALGSHYFQNKEFLAPINIEKWTVVEQAHYVKTGKEKIADGVLDFAYNIDEVSNANVLILSSVLQYLSNPYEWIEKFVNKEIKYIIIDRTAFSKENRNRLTLQIVPPNIYEASYPAWFLNEEEILKTFENKYRLIYDFDVTIDKVDEIPSIYKGFFFIKG